MDDAGRRRLKIFSRVEVVDLSDAPDLAARLSHFDGKAGIERAFVFPPEAFDWNRPQHVAPRFTLAQIEEELGAMRDRIGLPEAENYHSAGEARSRAGGRGSNSSLALFRQWSRYGIGPMQAIAWPYGGIRFFACPASLTTSRNARSAGGITRCPG